MPEPLALGLVFGRYRISVLNTCVLNTCSPKLQIMLLLLYVRIISSSRKY